MDSTLEQLFWGKVDFNGPNGCWIWLTGKGRGGYGIFHINGNKVKAHRISWEISNGPIPEGLFVLHRCDNPPCVNPSHLFLGTQKDNMQDMVRKGRKSYIGSAGEKNSNSKLKLSDVSEIRELRKTGMTLQKIADKFGISNQQVHSIVSKQEWKGV